MLRTIEFTRDVTLASGVLIKKGATGTIYGTEKCPETLRIGINCFCRDTIVLPSDYNDGPLAIYDYIHIPEDSYRRIR